MPLVGLFAARAVLAVDGNYSSPYASQWDSRMATASISDEAVIGGLLILLNLATIAILLLRDRRRRKSK